MPCSRRSQDEMHPGVCLNHIADLARLEPKRRVFERLLHLSRSERSEVTALVGGRAVRVLRRELAELVCVAVDLRLVTAEDLDRLFLRPGDIIL